jgi:Mg2+ and Co2+ transporter CorA
LVAGTESQGNFVQAMIEKTISEIEAKIGGAESISPERRRELLQMLATLKTEVAKLSKTDEEKADSIAGFAQVSAHEAMRAEQNPRLRELSLQGFRSSVQDLEQSHPRLTQDVNRISKTLSDLGI